MHSKVVPMKDAVAAHVNDGDTVVIEGFTHLICFAAGHEIIRQRRRDLTIARLTPDLIYDQMIAAGCARKLIFSWAGNPGAGSLHAFRRAVEKGTPKLEIEEYSHFGMVARMSAGAARLPFWVMRNYMGTDLPKANPLIRTVTCPYTGEELATVPALNPDVTVIHAQRADQYGNAQVWGLLGVQKEAAFASKRVIVVVEELVDQAVIRADPNRTLIPGMIVDAVVVEPWGSIPHMRRATTTGTTTSTSPGRTSPAIPRNCRRIWMNLFTGYGTAPSTWRSSRDWLRGSRPRITSPKA